MSIADYKKVLNRTTLVLAVPKTAAKQKKPTINKAQLDHLAQRRQKEPAPLLDEINRYLQLCNRYEFTDGQRLSELNNVLGMAYATIFAVKTEFLVGGVPDNSRRRHAMNAAIESIEQISLVYKRLLQQDYNSVWISFIRRKNRILSCAAYILELLLLEQELYAMRYQRLPPALWKDANQIFFAMRDCLEVDTPQLLLRHQFSSKGPKSQSNVTLRQLYTQLQVIGAMNIQDWECEHMNVATAYLGAVGIPDLLDDDGSSLLVEGQLLTQRGQSQLPHRRRPKETHKAIIIDARPLRQQLQTDYAQLTQLLAGKPARQPQVVAYLNNEQLAQKLVGQLLWQFEFQRRHNERQYFMGGQRMRVYSTWKDCAQLIKDLANWKNTEVRQSRQFRDTLAERSAAFGDSDDQVQTSEWLLLDESVDGARLRTQETQFTSPITIGQLVAYSPLDDMKSIQLAYVRRMVRNNDTEVDIGLSKFLSPAEWVAIQAPALQKTTTALGGILLGSNGHYALLTAHKHLFNNTYTDLVMFQKAYRMPFRVQSVNGIPPEFDILQITIDTAQSEHISQHENRINQEKETQAALIKAQQAKEKAAKLAQEEALRQKVKQQQEELIRREWKAGDVLVNLYEIQSLLGEGGMGKVYKAFHRAWRTELAIKRARPEFLAKAGGMDSFDREAQNWIKLGLHQNIVSCYYVRALGDTPLLFAEYVDGDSLRGWIYQHRFTTLAQILDVAIQFAWGLHHAHSHQLVHRDVKPANVMMTSTGIAKVTDFGLAQDVTEAIKDSDTMTQAYCSPEQMERKPLTLTTDIWSWGLSILEIFTGELTWMFGAMAPNVLEGYLEEPNPARQIPQMPDAVAKLLARCFNRDPQQRPDMLTVATELQTIYQQETGHPYPRRQPSADTESVNSLNNRAASLTDLGKLEEAQQLWQQALQIQPNHPESLYNTSLLNWRGGKLSDDELLRTLQSTPRSSNGHWMNDYMQALVHIERDDCEAAKPLLIKIQKTPDGRKEADNWLLTVQRRIDSRQFIGLAKAFTGEHIEPVCAVSLSQNGLKGVSASFSGAVKVWDFEKDRCVQSLQMHAAKTLAACISPDGERGLSGGEDNALKQWHTKTGNLENVISHAGAVTVAQFSPNGEYALSASLDKTLQLWSVNTRQRVATLTGHTAAVTGAVFNAGSTLVASCSTDGSLRIWGLDGKCKATLLNAHKEGVTAIAWLPNSPYLLSGGKDHLIYLWDNQLWNNSEAYKNPVRVFSGHQGPILALAIAGDGQQVISTAMDKTVRLWDLNSGRCSRTFTSEEDTLAVCIAPDYQTAYTGDGGWVMKRWRVRTPNALPPAPMVLAKMVESSISLEAAQTYNDSMQAAQQALAQGSFTQTMRAARKARSQAGFGYSQEAWELWSKLYTYFPRYLFQGIEQHHAWLTKPSRINCLGVNAGGQYLAAGDEHGKVQIWELKQKRSIHNLEGHHGMVNAVTFSADNRFLVSAGYDRTIRLWDMAEKKPQGQIFAGHEGPVTQVTLLRNNEFLLSSGEDKYLRLWHRASQACIHQFAGQNNFINGFALSLDERFVLTGGGSVFGNPDNSLRYWDIASGKCIRTLEGHDSWISAVCLTPDGQSAYSASHDKTIKHWNLNTGQCLKTFTEHQALVTCLALSADGSYLLSGSKDTTVKLWQLETGRCLHTLYGHGQPVRAVSLSQDGRYVFTAGDDYRVLVWQLDWDLQERNPEQWDWAILPWLGAFLNQQIPYQHEFSQLNLTGANRVNALALQAGQPRWTDKALKRLLYQLSCAGYGWVSEDHLVSHLNSLAAEWQGMNFAARMQVCPKCKSTHQYPPKCMECGYSLG